tara:strand:- start:195 stop:1829 length:1635 start_codon:yes stop_codon:yes gene_type:complete
MAILSQHTKSASKSNQNKNNSDKSVANAQSSNLIDNRPATIAQMKIADRMGKGPRAKKIAELQSRMAGDVTVQKVTDEEEVQMKTSSTQEKENKTGLPDNLKLGVENLSGISLDDVNVHTNSDQPAQMQAHAFAQGSDIHVAPGQEKHLAHEAWHVVQQKQGRVKPTRQMKDDTPVNDDKNLEIEADQMGAKALKIDNNDTSSTQLKQINSPNQALQRSSKSTLQKEGEDTAEPKAKDADKETGMKEVNKHSFELEIPNTFKASIEYDEDEEKGTVEIGDAEKGEAFKGFGGSGTVEKDDKTGNWKGAIDISLPQSPKAETPEVEVPIPPIPTGIPGLWVGIGLSAKASAEVGLSAGIAFELSPDKKPISLSILNGTVNPKASAEATAKLTADVGVPGVATLGAGIYGSATAELSSSLNIGIDTAKGLTAQGKLEGGLTGEIGALIEAKVLGFNIANYKRPLFEKEVAKFEKEFEGSLTPSSVIKGIMPSKSDIKANPNTETESDKANVSGDETKIDEAAAEPKAQEADKKTGIIRWLRRKFKR